jgi:DNA polymerase
MPPDPGLIAALRFQIDAGADEAIGEAPVDRYAAAPAPAPEAAPKTPPPPPPVEPAPLFAGEPEPTPRAGRAPALVSAREAGETARALAAAAGTVAELAAAVGRYDGCELKLTANRTVFADGNPEARLMIVGEAPGAEEDRQGLPFVGPAGQLLDRMLASIGLDRGSAYITNVVYWRPPGNRNPTGAEIATCLPFLVRHIELVAPAVLALAGGTAAKALLATNEGIMKLRGRWFAYESPGLARPIPVRAIFHPAFLLRSQGQKREAWRDLIAIRKRLEAGSP